MASRPKPLTEEQIATAAKFYRHGASIYGLARAFDLSPETVRRHLIANGVRMRSRSNDVTAWGETKSVADWARDPRCSVTVYTLHLRLKAGWEPQRAVEQGPIESNGAPRKPRRPRAARGEQARAVAGGQRLKG